MYGMTSEAQKSYLEGRVLTGRPLELVCVLYELALRAIRQARQHLVAGDRQARGRAVSQAVDTLTELIHALNRNDGSEISRNLFDLYGYMQQSLLKAHASESEQALLEIEGLLVTLLEGWRAVSTQDSRGAAVAPAQHDEAPSGFMPPAYAMPYSIPREPAVNRDWSF
jgi:flagellar secretion chaperone FliS